jgi:hypothetical protein
LTAVSALRRDALLDIHLQGFHGYEFDSALSDAVRRDEDLFCDRSARSIRGERRTG